MRLVPSFAGVGDLAYFDVIDSLPIGDVIGRTRKKGLVRRLAPFDEGVYFMSLKGWSPKINPVVKVAKSSPNYTLIEKKGLGKRSVQLIHNGGEIRLEDESTLETLSEVVKYERVENAHVNFTFFASTETSRENFLWRLKSELPYAGYQVKREKWHDYRIDLSSGREFKATDCRDYRFKGHIDETDPFKLVKFLRDYSYGSLCFGAIELTGFNNHKLGSFHPADCVSK